MDDSERFPFHSAVKSNNLEDVKLLLNENIDIYCQNDDGLTALHLLLKQKVALFDRLQSLKGDEFLAVCRPQPVRSKVSNGADAKKEELEDTDKSLSDIKREIKTNDQCIELILKNTSIRNSTSEIKLLLFYASCTLQNYLIVANLCEEILDINQSIGDSSLIHPGYTALHFAAHCNINIVELLIIKGANLLSLDVNGVTPLDICIKVFNLKEMHSILMLVPAWRHILFTDGKTELLNYTSSLQNVEKHKSMVCLVSKDATLSLSQTSPLWPGYSLLHISVILLPESNTNMLNDILTLNSDTVTAQDSHGSTALHLAFRQNKLKFVQLLLRYHHKAINCTDRDNLSHLHIATSLYDRTVVKKLLRNEVNCNVAYTGKPLSTLQVGWTPLHVACHKNYAVIAKLLLESGANLLQTDNRGFSAIHLLLDDSTRRSEKVAEVVFALEHLKECEVEGLGLTHLHVAAWTNQPQAIERLLDLGSDIDATIRQVEDEEIQNFQGCRPVHLAMMKRNHGIFDMLLDRGADIFTAKLDGSSPLSEVLSGKYSYDFLASVVNIFWNDKSLQDRVLKELGITELHIACSTFDEEKIEKLLQENININAKVHDHSNVWAGYTSLHILIGTGLKLTHCNFPRRSVKTIDNLCEVLLANNADVTLKNTDGDTPVLMALKADNLDHGFLLARYLMGHQQDFGVNPTNGVGMSHFHVACFLNDFETAESLWENVNQIDINEAIRSSDDSEFSGHTPLHLALSSQRVKHYDAQAQVQMVDFLLKRGADIRSVDTFGYTSIHKLLSCIATRNILLEKICIDGRDVNRQAADGKTPLELLLSSKGTYEEVKYLVDKGAKLNSYNPITNVGYLGIAVKTQRSSHDDSVIKLMMELPGFLFMNENDRNAIHNLISIENFHNEVSEYRYHGLVEELASLGCSISQQDIHGKTPLHLAVEFSNNEAVKALLDCGIDINIIDSFGKSPLSYAVEMRSSTKSDSAYCINELICKNLAIHLRKLEMIGLQVNRLNTKLLEDLLKVKPAFNLTIRESEIFRRCLANTVNIKMTENGFKLVDFLRPTGLVNMYSSLKNIDRQSVDIFFEKVYGDRVNLFGLKRFTKLQYRNAVERSSLINLAINALRLLVKFPMPDLCIEIIFVYLTNSDLKNMMTATIRREK